MSTVALVERRSERPSAELEEAAVAYRALWSALAELAAVRAQLPGGRAFACLEALHESEGCPEAFLRAERELLASIAASARNRPLARYALLVRGALEQRSLEQPRRRSRLLDLAVHGRLVAAIVRGEPPRAREAIGRHAVLLEHDLGFGVGRSR